MESDVAVVGVCHGFDLGHSTRREDSYELFGLVELFENGLDILLLDGLGQLAVDVREDTPIDGNKVRDEQDVAVLGLG